VACVAGTSGSTKDGIGAIALQEGVTPDVVTLVGEPYKAVLEIADQRHADLIVAGNQVGFTEKIVWHSKTAVLVVKTT